MNGRKAKMLRKAAGERAPVEYEPDVFHGFRQFPAYESYQRVVRSWVPKLGRIVAETITHLRMKREGRSMVPAAPTWHQVTDPDTGAVSMQPQMTLVEVPKPRRLAAGSCRRVYKELKTLDRRFGLEAVEKELRGAA